MENPRNQEHISTLTLVQRLLWWPKNSIQQSVEFFLSYLSNGDGSTCNGRKMEKSGDPRWRQPPRSQARSGCVRRLLAMKFYGQDRPVVALLPVRHVYNSGGRNQLPRLNPDRPKNGSKRPSSGFFRFLGFSLGFWGWIITWHPKLGLYRA